jgi:hypothetical protein
VPNLTDPISESAKILYVGDSGEGKTGSKAALVAAGFRLRMIDTDHGFKILRSLLTDDRYPYARVIKKSGLDLSEPGRVSYIPIDVEMEAQSVTKTIRGATTSYKVLGPKNSRAWRDASNLLIEGWTDGTQNFGRVTDWETDTVLDFDTISSLAECAKYWMQDLNNHLGAFEDDHGRDSGGAQELIRRLMTMVTSSAIRCNVIFTTHINWVDVGRGAAQSPSQLIHDQKPILDMRGFPAAIGQALSPQMGKKWNDLFIVRKGQIHSTTVDNVNAKHSAWVEDKYPLSTGLAEIFAALRYNPTLPNGLTIDEFVREIRPTGAAPDKTAAASVAVSPFRSRQ